VRALIFRDAHSVAVETVEDPRLSAPTDALVRVDLAAVCGSDLHVYHGREPDIDRGTVMGHEFVGEIVECGDQVRGVQPGDRVLSPFTTNCGRCFYCLEGLTARCERGQLFGWLQEGEGLHGAQAEYVRVPLAESTLLSIPEGVSDDEALLLGDVASTGYYCASRADIRPEGVYVVLGCGPVGLMAVVAAIELGAATVFAVDSVPERLTLARGFGAQTIDLAAGDPAQQVREATDGRGADAVLEAVGSPEATRLGVDLLRAGGTLSVVGVHHEERLSFSPVVAYDKNLTYRIGRCPARSVMEELIPVVRRKRFDLASIISHRLPLDRGVEAYEMFANKTHGCTKVVLRPGSD
jgi:2-desacetyl-2-hydroxyethyl bacteriochlorophyllide A dehydrogenase